MINADDRMAVRRTLTDGEANLIHALRATILVDVNAYCADWMIYVTAKRVGKTLVFAEIKPTPQTAYKIQAVN